MKRSYVISDWFFRLSHTVKRNKTSVLVYALVCLLFLVVGIAVGATMSDKTEYILKNGAGIFVYLRGDMGVIALFFRDMLLLCVYGLFTSSMFFFKALPLLSVVPCAYRAYVLGVNTCVIIAVFSVSALPMLFVAFIPVGIVEIGILCMLSFRCFSFSALTCSRPSKPDLKEYYCGLIKFVIVLAVAELVKCITLVLFGSALIGAI